MKRKRIFARGMQENTSVTDKPEPQNEEQQARDDGPQTGPGETPDPETDSAQTPESEVDNELMDFQFALGAAEQELAQHKEAMLRMQAEMENLRKRLIRDLDRSRRRALESIMSDLLPVQDSLERGLGTDEATTTVEAMKEGKALIIKMLSKVMEDHGLTAIDPVGEPFNPELHQAMTVQASAEHEPNTVLEVLQKGFQLHDRLIRPAMVVVSKKPDSD